MDVEHIEGLLAARGLVLTARRRAIVEYLSGATHHPTAAQIHAAVPGSLSTVYNTLTLLRELGVLEELPQPGGESRFDPNTAPHHHLLCMRCGRLHDLPMDSVRVELLHDLPVSGVRVTLEGACPGGRCELLEA